MRGSLACKNVLLSAAILINLPKIERNRALEISKVASPVRKTLEMVADWDEFSTGIPIYRRGSNRNFMGENAEKRDLHFLDQKPRMPSRRRCFRRLAGPTNTLESKPIPLHLRGATNVALIALKSHTGSVCLCVGSFRSGRVNCRVGTCWLMWRCISEVLLSRWLSLLRLIAFIFAFENNTCGKW